MLRILDIHGYKCLEKAIKYAEAIKPNIKTNALIDCYKKLTQFNMHNLKHAEDDLKNIYVSSLIKTILKAMALGSIEAKQFFPILLQYDQITGSMKDIFIELVSFNFFMSAFLRNIDNEYDKC